ncbi:hypothetical protein [Caballeronia catudaia]|nr:hypothetical protein [Caballeronia catudaia]
MKKVAVFVLFTVAGCVTAIAVSSILLAFDRDPGCGLDCPSPGLTAALFWGIAIALIFAVVGFVCARPAPSEPRRIVVVLAVLVGSALLGASARYVFELHDHYREAEAARPVVADFNFMYMAIATRDVQTYTKAERGALRAASVIPQWQRCVIDGASCGGQNKQAHMRCKSGVVYVNEPDWKSFSLIPQENLQGAIAMKSMNLCAPDNVPDE